MLVPQAKAMPAVLVPQAKAMPLLTLSQKIERVKRL